MLAATVSGGTVSSSRVCPKTGTPLPQRVTSFSEARRRARATGIDLARPLILEGCHLSLIFPFFPPRVSARSHLLRYANGIYKSRSKHIGPKYSSSNRKRLSAAAKRNQYKSSLRFSCKYLNRLPLCLISRSCYVRIIAPAKLVASVPSHLNLASHPDRRCASPTV
jgi:hypothetical protein